MLGPEQVRVKRKRDETAPDTLIVEPHHKRAFTDNAVTQLQYVRQQNAEFSIAPGALSASSEEHMQWKQEALNHQPKEDVQLGGKAGRRTFHLTHARAGEGVKKTRKSKESNVATFVEKPIATTESAAVRDTARSAQDAAAVLPSDSRPLKRPGKGTAAATKARRALLDQQAQGTQPHEHIESLANDLHQFTLDELASAPKPKVTAVPRLSAARSRDIHQQRSSATATQIRDQEMTDDQDGDYVYETYVLAPSGGARAADADPTGDVGYLIITEDDQSIWEAYIEDEPSDKDWDTDDEDENAEDYYGADYPEDELASDDEFDRNAYGYRRNAGSDNEEYDEDTGTYSGDEEDGTMNPWRAKTSTQFAKYLEPKQSDD
ncbi:hypothetical protein LTR36_001893 [Oleoguttula mirabilis]|uniref:Transcription factor Iwr1 domain-containing protein n=1 Tax=Oleoguttula mirabilis TaxID=1507867 RepID=A0AAV9JMC8_9PEZI|nr:hypothetical protein LTR36_001893 [Oleoguttula mirabilis]